MFTKRFLCQGEVVNLVILLPKIKIIKKKLKMSRMSTLVLRQSTKKDMRIV